MRRHLVSQGGDEAEAGITAAEVVEDTTITVEEAMDTAEDTTTVDIVEEDITITDTPMVVVPVPEVEDVDVELPIQM